MKAAIVITNELKQIMLTPESDVDKMILEAITPSDDISIEIKNNVSFYDHNSTPQCVGYNISKCAGDYLRAYESSESVMLVLTPKNKLKTNK